MGTEMWLRVALNFVNFVPLLLTKLQYQLSNSSYISTSKAAKSWHPFTLIHVHCFLQRVKITSLFYTKFFIHSPHSFLPLHSHSLPSSLSFFFFVSFLFFLFIFYLSNLICVIRFIFVYIRQPLSKEITI